MLHLTIWIDFGSIISRSFMLSHLGLFLLWQPVWRGDEKLGLENTFLFIVFTFALTIFLNPWLLFAWLVLLIGFISGRVTLDRKERAIYLLALAYLVLELLFACIPELVKIEIVYSDLFKTVLPAIPFCLLFFPKSKPDNSIQTVDFIHAITTSMLTSLVVFGSLLNMFISQSSYFTALAQTSIAIGVFIICISWLLTSQSRFSGLTQLWSNYMLNIGTPFEKWLTDLSKVSERDQSPEEFLDEALNKLVNLSWISGITWSTESDVHETGNKTVNEIDLTDNMFSVCIYTYRPAGISLKLHCHLLIKLLRNFYINKQREQELTRQAHLKAIYETGARITHDIKNLLQSFQAIASIVTHDSDDSNTLVSQQVLKKQLPQLTQRLQLALDKLSTPELQDTAEIHLKDWWRDLQRRNTHNQIIFQSSIEGDITIPVDMFDSVIDNLLENIQTKKFNRKDIKITISLASNESSTSVTICDTGDIIPDHISKQLLKNPIQSDNGLGIGLYQANKHAEMFGYQLQLINNDIGRVCFELSSKQDR